MTKRKHVYLFGGGKSEGKAEMKQLLGGKGANLAEMASLGLPVPPGFTITTEACGEYYKIGKKKLFAMIKSEIDKALKNLEKITGKTFGKGPKPLLLSVRSGAAVSPSRNRGRKWDSNRRYVAAAAWWNSSTTT